MRKIAIINQKGGSGKTTTTVNLAACLAEQKRRVLLVDLDPQASSSQWYNCSTVDKGLYDLFTTNISINSIIKTTSIENLYIIPASSWLIGLEKAIASEVGSEIIFKQRLEQLEVNNWDYVLIDCPPALSILTINALSAVSEVIIPVEARVMALAGLVQLLQTIDIVKSRLNSSLSIAGIVPCRVDNRTRHSKEIVDELTDTFKEKVYKTIIRENIKLAEAPSFKKPITAYDPSSNGAYDYRALSKEIIKQEKIIFQSAKITQSKVTV